MIRPALLRPRRWTPGSAARRSPPAFWAVALLVCSLLWAQAAGVLHRIEHAGGLATPHASALLGAVVSASPHASADEASPSSLHSCVLFDGLCMADSLPTALLPTAVTGQMEALPSATIFASWHALFVSHFLSRGPPAA